ncbi:MAG TPA: hypothetical protein VFU28_16695 [Vicinamibacterales bacterium]|nr:hypothetical protein [Vicinamibacterales bacterium]
MNLPSGSSPERRELSDRRLGVGVARGDVLGPPLGNTTLHWRDWTSRLQFLPARQPSCDRARRLAKLAHRANNPL